MAVAEVIVGREPSEIEKYGSKGCVFLGKHVVGTGEEAHTTNKVLMDVSRPHVVLILGKRGSGKCLEENTLITLEDGSLAKIRDLSGDKNKVFALNQRLKMAPSSKDGFFEREVDKLLHIKLRSGREIKLTPEHPLLTIRGWKEANSLTIGSRIATPRKTGAFGKESMKEHEIKLLAYLIAEGHLGNNFVLFSNMDEQIKADFFSSVKQFDKDLKIEQHSKDGCYRITKSDVLIKHFDSMRKANGTFVKRKSSICNWLVNLGLYGRLSRDKFIPNCIFRLPKEQLAIFLNRLFSCDGSIYKHKTAHGEVWEVSYSSSSKILIEQVYHLLLRFGILSKMRGRKVKFKEKYFDSYEIQVRTENVQRFIEEIGFFGRKEEIQGYCFNEIKDIERNPNVDTIPQEIWDIYRPGNWANIGRTFGYATPKALRSSIGYSPSRQKLLTMAEAEGNEALRLIAESDIFWDEIVKIELLEGNFRVYDISVPELHNFVANDIIVHNSYSGAVIAEEVMNLPEDIRQNLSILMIDTMGIFWSMKTPNEHDITLLSEWGIKPRSFPIQNVVPAGLTNFYEKSGIAFDKTFAINPSELSSADWAHTFGFSLQEPLGILLERVIKKLQGSKYGIKEIIEAIEQDRRSEEKEKLALENRFLAAENWGIFSEEATPIEDFLKPGIATVLDVSLQEWNVRNLMLGILAREIYQVRVAARRQEELELMAGEEKKKVPMTWIIIDEAHNFIPSEGETAATSAMLTLVRQGRQPGVSLALITQRPNKFHEDVIAQADLIISHRLTSKQDLDALSSVMQTYLLSDIRKSISALPRSKGSALVLDDNSERLYNIQVRPRQSWHAGGSPIAIKEKG